MDLVKQIGAYRKNFELFAKECLRIENKAGQIQPLTLNRVQGILWRRMLDCLASGKPVRWMVLKGRQMGLTTFSAAVLFWLCSLRRHKSTLIVAHNEDSSRGIHEKIRLFYRNMPENVRPAHRTNNRRELYLTDPDPTKEGLESSISVSVAADINLGRSKTLQAALLSEYAFWEKDPAQRLVALQQAIPYLKGTMMIIESTAWAENHFSQKWYSPGDYETIFICWVADEAYQMDCPEGLELSQTEDSIMGDETIEAQYIEEALRLWYPELSEEELPAAIKARLKWRRWMIENQLEGDKTSFRKEYPTIPEHAFMSAGVSVFNNFQLAAHRNSIREQGIEPVLYSYDPEKEDFYQSASGKFRIYSMPVGSQIYALGADVAEGLEAGDESAIVILDGMGRVVAVYNSIVPPHEFAELVNGLGRIYNNALVGVEVNDRGGWSTIEDLQNVYRYPRLYMRERTDTMRPGVQAKYGWKTTALTKDLMVGALRGAIAEDSIYIPDIPVLKQLMGYQKLPNGSLGCPRPMHDDLVTALCISLQMLRNVHQVSEAVLQRTPPKYSVDWWMAQNDNGNLWQSI